MRIALAAAAAVILLVALAGGYALLRPIAPGRPPSSGSRAGTWSRTVSTTPTPT